MCVPGMLKDPKEPQHLSHRNVQASPTRKPEGKQTRKGSSEGEKNIAIARRTSSRQEEGTTEEMRALLLGATKVKMQAKGERPSLAGARARRISNVSTAAPVRGSERNSRYA